jgi:uncharacterized protein with HEPN domain
LKSLAKPAKILSASPPQNFFALNSDLPLSFAYDMRNLLAHGYYKVDLEVVWKTIEADLPNLKVLVEKAIEGL